MSNLQQAQALEAHRGLAGDYQMIVRRDRDQRQRRLKFRRHVDVGAQLLGLAARMVVDEDQ